MAKNKEREQRSGMTENVENYDVNNRILDIFFYDSDNFVSHIINNKLLFLYKKLFFKIHLNAILFSQQAMDVNNDGGGIFVNHFSVLEDPDSSL